jgi:hypothetical protein
VTRKLWAGWKFRLPRTGPRRPALADAEQETTPGKNQMRPASEPWAEVADHELALMSAEFLSGTPYPDLEDAAEVAAWRAEHADLLSKGPEAVMELADAREAEFEREAEAEWEQEDAEQDRLMQEQADRELEWLEGQPEAEGAERELESSERQPGTEWELEP